MPSSPGRSAQHGGLGSANRKKNPEVRRTGTDRKSAGPTRVTGNVGYK
jgi:hypothetical protein